MKAQELREKSPEELQTLLKETRENIDKTKNSLYQGKIKNVKEFGSQRKDVARILTVLRQRI